MSNFLQNLKVGDKAVCSTRFNETVVEIKKITKTMIIDHQGRRFNKKSGRLVGSQGFYWAYLIEFNDNVKNRINHRHLVYEVESIIKDIKLQSLPVEKLEKIKQFFESLNNE